MAESCALFAFLENIFLFCCGAVLHFRVLAPFWASQRQASAVISAKRKTKGSQPCVDGDCVWLAAKLRLQPAKATTKRRQIEAKSENAESKSRKLRLGLRALASTGSRCLRVKHAATEQVFVSALVA